MPPLLRLRLLACLFLCVASSVRAENVAETQPGAPVVAPEADDQPSELETELEAEGFRLGAPAFIRIFKADSALEVWLMKGTRFELFRRYTICKWSGVLGPKLYEGDRQSPEGVYFITGGDLVVNKRWHRAMNVGFPNVRDTAVGLTGSNILIHGKCTSIGCFALTDGVVEDVYDIVEAALEAGQPRIGVHIFPFALTAQKLAGAASGRWSDFWQELKRGHDLFLRDRLPPRTFACNGHYAFQSRRQRVVPLAGNPVCSEVTRPARPLVAASMVASIRHVLPRPQLIRRAARSSAGCPRKYGRCRNSHTAALKSVDCPLKYPRCRKHGSSARPSMASLKTKRNSR